MAETSSLSQVKMGKALLWTSLLNEPLSILHNLLPIILCKDLGASTLQITLLVTLKPVMALFSFYWSSGLKGRSHKLKSNVIWAGIWMRLPFFLCPWIDSSWFLVLASANYMFFYRAGAPAWLEMLRRTVGEEKRGRAFSLSAALGYAEGVVLSLAMGAALDGNSLLWMWLLPLSSLVGLVSVVMQGRVPVEIETEEGCWVPLKERLIRPWRDSYRLLKERSDFARFQWGFMGAGFGLMLIQAVIPLFMVNTLEVSYLEISAALSIAKALGFVVSSSLWGRWFSELPIFRVASFVFLCTGLFPLLLSFSVFGMVWLYVAYFWYGIAQGGSHLVWNLSGPVFAGKEESSRYTGIGVVLVGLRGGVAPPLGGFLAVSFGYLGVLLMGASLCLFSGLQLLRYIPLPAQNYPRKPI